MFESLHSHHHHPNWFDPDYAAAQSATAPYFFSLHAKTLDMVLWRDYDHFIEAGAPESMASALSFIDKEQPDFFLSLTTASAYSIKVAEFLTTTLMMNFSMPLAHSTRIETSLHEAIANALIHGNLQVESGFCSFLDFNAYCNLINSRLAQHRYTSRRLNLAAWHEQSTLTLMIEDEGEGFTLNIPSNDAGKLHGRGFALMASLADALWMGANRRSLFLRFDLEVS